MPAPYPNGLLAAPLQTFANGAFQGLVVTPATTQTLYAGLLGIGDPTTDHASIEISKTGTGYARQAVLLSAADATGLKKNASAAVIFGPNISVSDWTIVYYGLWTAATNGTFLGFWTIRDVATGDKINEAEGVAVEPASSAVFAVNAMQFTVSCVA